MQKTRRKTCKRSGKCGLNVEEGRIGQDKVEERKNKFRRPQMMGKSREDEVLYSLVIQ